ncbi:unnamed protein product [Arctogadus glacialis]
MDAGQRTQPFRGAYASGGIPVLCSQPNLVGSSFSAYGAFEYSLRADSDLGSEATPTLKSFYYFARSLEENMDATRKAVVAVALAEDQAIQYK